MGGKSTNSTSQVQIPPAVLSQYQSLTANADQIATTPFQQYGGQFVAPVNSEQQTGIANTNTAANEAQPYYGAATSTLGSAQSGVNPINSAATGLAGASAEQVNAQPLTGQDVNQYLSPYLGDVLGTTNALANQNNSIAQSGALGTAISSGAFGGDRTGIAAANLNQQNQLAEQATDANILNTGYNTALSNAQQQQGVNLWLRHKRIVRRSVAAGSELAIDWLNRLRRRREHSERTRQHWGLARKPLGYLARKRKLAQAPYSNKLTGAGHGRVQPISSTTKLSVPGRSSFWRTSPKVRALCQDRPPQRRLPAVSSATNA